MHIVDVFPVLTFNFSGLQARIRSVSIQIGQDGTGSVGKGLDYHTRTGHVLLQSDHGAGEWMGVGSRTDPELPGKRKLSTRSRGWIS